MVKCGLFDHFAILVGATAHGWTSPLAQSQNAIAPKK